MNTFTIIVFILLGIFILVFVVLMAFMALLFYSFYGASGWKALAQRYGTNSEPLGTLYKGQTIKVGGVRWRFSTTAGVGANGLYLAVVPFPRPFSRIVQHPPLLIPWSNIRVAGPGHIYVLWKAIELSVGNPRITSLTVTQKLFEVLSPHISESR
jgi:hypothetical protein